MSKVKRKAVKAARSKRRVGMSGMVRARIDPAVKLRAETILAELGLNASDAIRIFYKQVTLQKGLPFAVLIPNEETQKAMANADAGLGLTRYPSVAAMVKDLSR
jgi:DNA-damage-inducible protein J